MERPETVDRPLMAERYLLHIECLPQKCGAPGPVFKIPVGSQSWE